MRIAMNKLVARRTLQKIPQRLLFTVLLLVLVYFSIPNVAAADNNVFTSTQLRLSGSGSDSVRYVIPTADGGFLATVGTNSTDGDMAGLGTITSIGSVLVKYDENNNIIWKKMYNDYYIKSLASTDNGYVAVGEILTSKQALILKIDSLGNALWVKEFGGSSTEDFTGVTVMENNELIVVGFSQSTDGDLTGLNKGDKDAIIAKFNSGGVLIWVRNFGGTAADSFSGVTVLNNGNIVAVGDSSSIDGDMTGINLTVNIEAIIAVYNKEGHLVNKKKFGGSSSDNFVGVTKTEDGGFAVVGKSSSIDGDLLGYASKDSAGNALAVKYDVNVNKTWTQVVSGNKPGSNQYFQSISQTPEGNFVAAGTSSEDDGPFMGLSLGNNDGMVVEMDQSGNVLRLDAFGSNRHDYFYSGVLLNDGNTYVAVGDTQVDINGNYLNKNLDGFLQIVDLRGLSKAPVFVPDITGPTNKDVKVEITFPVNTTSYQYKIGDAVTWKDYLQPIVVTSNNNIFARYKDNTGNLSQEYSFPIGNIDKTPPVAPIITADIQTPTKNPVTITIQYYQPGATTNEYRINEGEWLKYLQIGGLMIFDNGSVEARAIDSVGNISEISRYEIYNIVFPADATITADTTILTNKNVNVTINYPSDVSVKQYKIDDGLWLDWYSNPITIYVNSTIYARSRFSYGSSVSNVTSYKISNIDKIPPAVPIITVDKTEPTNSDVTVTIKFASDSVKNSYTLHSDVKRDYIGPIKVTSNATIRAFSWDEAGNLSENSFSINNIDKTGPNTPIFNANRITPINGDVTVTILYPNDAVTKEYRVNNGDWSNYQKPITFTENGKLEARGADALGNMSDIGTYNVTNIDKVPPVKPTITADITTPTNKEVKLIINASSYDTTDKLYVKINDDEYKVFTMGSTFTFTANGTANAVIIDAANNKSPYASYSVKNIDKTPPAVPVITASSTKPTQDNVTLTVSFTAETGLIKEFRLDSGAWAPYTAPIVIEENTLINVRATDVAGNISTASYTVSNIDRIPPKILRYSTSTSNTTGYVMLSVVYDEKSVTGEYRLSGGTWTAFTDTSFLVSENGTYEIRGTDAAGNVSTIETVTVNSINLTPQYHYNTITGRLESIEYSPGKKYYFIYDKNGNLIKKESRP